MGLIQAFTGAIDGTFAAQWKDIVTAGPFGEYTVVTPGVRLPMSNGQGATFKGPADVISNGSKILVPENTAAFVFDEAGIQEIVVQAGGYEYQAGVPSSFSGDGVATSVVHQTAQRFAFGGQPHTQQWIVFVNLREIRGIKFGTRSPMVYHDRFYGVDLELVAFGTFSLRVVDPVTFVRNFLPPNTRYYAFDSVQARRQVSSEFIQAFAVAVNSLSGTLRISELPAHAGVIAASIADDHGALGGWIRRFGLDVVQVGIESISFSSESRSLVQRYSSDRMSLAALEGISQQASNTAAQQKIARGVQGHGLGDGAGIVFGMNFAQGLSPQTAAISPTPTPTGPTSAPSLDAQIEAIKKLKELLDAGVLTQEEFDAKKKQVLGL